jgi:hypothetical protein
MSDEQTQTSTPEQHYDLTQTTTAISGGINLGAQRDVTIGGDVVGRDQIMAGCYILRPAKWCLPSFQLTHPLLNRIPAVVRGCPVRRIAVLGTV